MVISGLQVELKHDCTFWRKESISGRSRISNGKSPMFAELCVFGAKRQGGQKDGSEDVVIKIVPTEDVINAHPDNNDLEKVVIKEVKELSKRLSNFKRPTSIIVSKEALPRTATKKLNVKKLKKNTIEEMTKQTIN